MSSSMSADQRKALVRQCLEMGWDTQETYGISDAHAQNTGLEDKQAERHCSTQETVATASPPCIYLGAERFSTSVEQIRRTLCTTFPDIRLSVVDILVEDEKVVARWLMRGTDLGGYEGHLPTGRSIHLTGMLMARFENDMMVEVWNEVDLAGMLQQLGFVYIPQPPKITVRRPEKTKMPYM